MGATGSNSPKFTPLLSNAVTPQTSRPKCLCLLHPIMSSLRHYLSFSPHLSSLGDLIFCHVFLIFTSMLLPFISPLLSPPIYMFLVRMGVWWVLSELLNRMHLPRTRKCCENRHSRRIVPFGEGGGGRGANPDEKHNLFLISNFRLVLNIVLFLLGVSQTSECYVATFRNIKFRCRGIT